MTKIINLKRVRKQKARGEAEAHAANNRVTHGRTKAEKKRSQAEAEAAAKQLDGHKREPND